MLRLISHGSDVLEGQGTFLSSVINLSAATMGCSILALPQVFAHCGMSWSMAFLLIFSLWVELSLRWLVACGRYSGYRGFKENAQYFLGASSAKLVHLCQVLLLCGGIVMIFVTACSLLGCSARELLASLCTEEGQPQKTRTLARLCQAHPAPCMPPERALSLIVLVVFPLACQKSLHSLTSISMISFVCLAYFFGVLLVRLAHRAMSAPLEFIDMGQEDMPLFWQGPPVLLMSFLCHTTMLQLDAELCTEAKAKVSSVIRLVVLGLALPVYATVGAGGFWLKGPKVSANVLQDFTQDPWMAAARLTLGVMNVAKLATAVITLRESLVSLAPSRLWRKRLRSWHGRAALSLATLVLGAVAAFAIPSLTTVLSLLGSTVGVLFSLCLPAALYAMLLRRVSSFKCKRDDLEEPLLPSTPGRAESWAEGSIQVPRSDMEWLRQWLLCGVVFTGGLFVGGLGLLSWARDP